MKIYAQYKSNGTLWRAGNSILGLCAAYNHATNPSLYMSESDHKRSFSYARSIKTRINRLGYQHGKHFKEMSNGSLWPISA